MYIQFLLLKKNYENETRIFWPQFPYKLIGVNKKIKIVKKLSKLK